MYNITGEVVRLMEYRDSLYIWLKELEGKRIENDLLNCNKYDELYKLYHSICNTINELN